jgi:alpha-L-fucosidase
MFCDAARKHGLRFGVSDHLWISYKWFAVSHMSDKTGPLAGVPYDGTDPANADLYHKINDPALFTAKLEWNDTGITEEWKQHWFLRIKDLVDQYQPDVLYSDGPLPFGDTGVKLLAHFYNENAKRHGGHVEAVYTSKRKEDALDGICLLDKERGVLNEIWPQPWQTDTCIGEWHYHKGITYKTPKRIVDLLVDVVSRNGNLMLNFPLPSNGMLDDEELRILGEFTKWMDVNSEAIYSTRPWKIAGGGPSMKPSDEKDANFNEKNRKDLTTEDFRFTTKKGTLYALVMGWPEQAAVQEVLLPPLGTAAAAAKVQNVELLGHRDKLKWSQDAAALRIALPPGKPCEHAVAFKISGLL